MINIQRKKKKKKKKIDSINNVYIKKESLFENRNKNFRVFLKRIRCLF
jgi:hypothetical protein